MTASVGEARRRLPREFIQSLEGSFPPHVADSILRGMGARRRTTLRVNTLRWSAADLLGFFRENAVKHERVSWYPDAFVLRDLRERDVETWEAYREGRVYLQSLSSMMPALALDPRPGEQVLDLTAAPGSKTTQMSALMGGQGRILANEMDSVRAQRLQFNVRLQGCPNVELRLGRGEKVGQEMPDAFDRVLLDAPCSGEGRFIVHEPATSRGWSPRTISECARLQRRLLVSACRCLKPDGVLVYSTCTLNLEENERAVNWALHCLPLRVEALPVSIPGSWQGMARGVDASLSRALRVFPDDQREGFFICRMRKTAG
ncbi:MAG TPA: RsmB/NOP family class I SAM-dependent RNA methyltransferase [Spirochaetia bacterium]|nr:RsmB/NOP family class I SAM-dependent RNA methyltransferase [Spirochaetia bacterium]